MLSNGVFYDSSASAVGRRETCDGSTWIKCMCVVFLMKRRELFWGNAQVSDWASSASVALLPAPFLLASSEGALPRHRHAESPSCLRMKQDLRLPLHQRCSCHCLGFPGYLGLPWEGRCVAWQPPTNSRRRRGYVDYLAVSASWDGAEPAGEAGSARQQETGGWTAPGPYSTGTQ